VTVSAARLLAAELLVDRGPRPSLRLIDPGGRRLDEELLEVPELDVRLAFAANPDDEFDRSAGTGPAASPR
jgi:hypothetical protein